MRNILLFCILFYGVLMTGCASQTIVTGTMRTLDVPSEVGMLPIAADLKVAEQRSQGVASGHIKDSASIYEKATAIALGQNPPTVNGADLLVAHEIYSERKRKKISLTVTGYPAWYHNFRTIEPDEDEVDDSTYLLIPGRLAGGITRSVSPSLTTPSMIRERERVANERNKFLKYHRMYLGGTLGGGKYIRSHDDSDDSSDESFAAAFVADFPLLAPVVSFETGAVLGYPVIGLYGMGRVGFISEKFELTGDIGFVLGSMSWMIGATAGLNVGPGMLFVRGHFGESEVTDAGDTAIFSVGYKIGIGSGKR